MILQGDCLEIMPSFPNKHFNMIFCDLPFGTTQNAWDSILPLDQLWNQYKRIIKDGGVIALYAQTPFDKILGASNLEMLKYEWIWEKQKATGFLNARKAPLKAHENILIFYKGSPTYNPQMTPGEPYDKGIRKAGNGNGTYGNFVVNPIINETGDRFPRSVIKFKTADAEGEIFHPTQKPIGLSEYFIKTYTNEGESVLDNTAGSGSVGVACMNTNREFTLIEKEKKYFDHCVRRTTVDYKYQMKLF
jgi:site-specific DNA-methyltransferase (adenine-specific)